MTADTDLELLVTAVEEVFTETLALVRGLDDEQGGLPTDCPGWTVKDNLAHMVGLEQVLAGGPEPDVEVPDLDHVRSDTDRYMETHVQARRALPLSVVADELAGFLPRRLAQLGAQVRAGDVEVPGPFGPRRLSASLPIRLLDLWAHESDIRRAVAVPVRLTGTAPALVARRVLEAWASVLPSRLGGDATLEITVTDPPGHHTTIVVGSGGPLLRLEGDLDLLSRLGFGRGDPHGPLASVVTGGADELVATLAPHLAFTP